MKGWDEMFAKTEAISMKVDGLNDVSSQHAVTQVLKGIRGVRTVSVNRQSATAEIQFRPDQTTVDTVVRALNEAGYPVI